VAPYTWSLLSGTLPPGLTLSGSGMISGTPSTAGIFDFQVQVKDSAGTTASANFAVTIAPLGSCGPPNYCSRTDLVTVQLPSPLPSVGNLTGANTLVTDPAFSNRIVRVTDANTDPSRPNFTFIATASGSADENQWNTDSTLFMSYNMNAGTYPFSFDPTTMQVSRLYVSNFPATGGMQLNTVGEWSRANSQWWYTMDTGSNGLQILKYDFTDRSTPPAPQLVYDFSSSANCLGSGFKQTWAADGGIAASDAVFSMAFANSGGQDGNGANFVAVYTPGKGCRVWNTATGQVTGDWGPTGTISLPDRVHIHNMKMSKDGNWIIVTWNNCASSCPDSQPFFWNIPTLNAYTMPSCQTAGGSCGGHWTMGYSTYAYENKNSPPDFAIMPFSNTSSLTVVDPNQPAGFAPPWDQHNAWNNTNATDSVPFCTSSFNPTGYNGTLRFAWDQEILCFAVNGSGKVWRFAHTFSTDKSQRFSTSEAIGTVSQDGQFYIFSSDWMGTLGAEGGGASCTIGSNCRGDVFIVELK
jgi:hypothetical protein